MKAMMKKKSVVLDKPSIPRLISVIDGQDREDIPYYLAMMIAGYLDKRVLVLDNTRYGLLYNAIPASDGVDLKEQGNVSFLRQIALSQEFFMRFDCVICMHGEQIDRDLFMSSGFYLVLTGYRPYALARLLCSQNWADTPDSAADLRMTAADFLKEDNSCIFFLDKVTGKVSVKPILNGAGLAEKEIPIVELSLDEKDQICLMNLLYNGHQNPGSVSKETLSALTGMLSLCTDIPVSQLKNRR